MKIIRYYITLVSLLMVIAASAQDSTCVVEPENILKIQYGWVKQLDPYLSPLAYRGQQIGIGNEWWQPFHSYENWKHVGRIDIHGLRAYSSAWTNYLYGLNIRGGWGAYYRMKWLDERLSLIVGPYLEADFMIRNIGTNINKPFSFDVGINAMVMAGISWSFYGPRTSYRLRYQIRTNLIGFDWLPDYWQSYYEVTEGVSGLARCSGHWNHNTVRHELTLDFQFPHSTWRIGAEHEFLNYTTKDMQFTRNQINILVGCIWHYRLISNRKL